MVKQEERGDSDRLLIAIRDTLRGSAFALGWVAVTIGSEPVIGLLGIVAIALWHTSTRFHPTRATIFESTSDSNDHLLYVKGEFFGRPFQLTF